MIKYCGLFVFAFVLLCKGALAQNQAKFSDIQPGMMDGEIEQQAVKIANQRAVDFRCPEDYTKAVIISREWQYESDGYGSVIGRFIHLELYCERPEGACGMADFIFKQKYTDEGAYSRKLYFVSMGDTFTVDCEP